ncbi:MAG: hypothetical protein J6N81_11890 [Treponema sp.]|nr:hypothetical protein [Treponema sp.]
MEFLVTGRERKSPADSGERYSADVRILAKKLSAMTENEKKLVTALVEEIERQRIC